ncbi:MAG: hypothetical protein ACI92E_001943 [Oceanicoccus sp.]|jgi:hypothetical protein
MNIFIPRRNGTETKNYRTDIRKKQAALTKSVPVMTPPSCYPAKKRLFNSYNHQSIESQHSCHHSSLFLNNNLEQAS